MPSPLDDGQRLRPSCVIRHFDTRKVQYRRRDIDVSCYGVNALTSAGVRHPGHGSAEDTASFLVGQDFAAKAMRSIEKTVVVRIENPHGVLRHPLGLKCVHDHAHCHINPMDLLMIQPHGRLVGFLSMVAPLLIA